MCSCVLDGINSRGVIRGNFNEGTRLNSGYDDAVGCDVTKPNVVL